MPTATEEEEERERQGGREGRKEGRGGLKLGRGIREIQGGFGGSKKSTHIEHKTRGTLGNPLQVTMTYFWRYPQNSCSTRGSTAFHHYT